ncbi:MAG: class I SAM-dependent methyltransferase [Candidatus Thermoplasmatota archaeon]|nr:class I SAM-dependent methyltransferase [Candidatus Thermoplasmatota archaeon]
MQNRRERERKYAKEINSFISAVSSFLPERCANLLEIGCGIGGVSLGFYIYYQKQTNLYMLDKNKIDENLHYGFDDFYMGYNNMAVTKEFLTTNGVNERHITLIDIEKDKFPSTNFDIVASSLSWGYHYPLDMYISEVLKNLNKNGLLIIHLRKKRREQWETLNRFFKNIHIINSFPKFDFVVAKELKREEDT